MRGQVTEGKSNPLCGTLVDLRLSQAASLVAWSLTEDGSLVCTDVATCQTRTRKDVPPCKSTLDNAVTGAFWGLTEYCGT
jgi:hypothetical protein